VKQEIIVIGPIGAGKSTQARLLSERLGLPRCSMDDVRWSYYKEIGYDEALAKQISAKDGFLGLYRYWKPFEAHAVERLLAEHHDCGMSSAREMGAATAEDSEYAQSKNRARRQPGSRSRNLLLASSCQGQAAWAWLIGWRQLASFS
jgi:hypothetical protein